MSHINLLVALIRNVQTYVTRDPKLPSIAKGLISSNLLCIPLIIYPINSPAY